MVNQGFHGDLDVDIEIDDLGECIYISAPLGVNSQFLITEEIDSDSFISFQHENFLVGIPPLSVLVGTKGLVSHVHMSM